MIRLSEMSTAEMALLAAARSIRGLIKEGGGCGLNHPFWERYLAEAKRFIAAFEALMSVQKENLH